MCIIAVKAANVAPPSVETLRAMFRANPDGAGVAYVRGGYLVISKGHMIEADFLAAAAKIPQDSPAVYHCRIETSGGVCKALTHPFYIDKDIKKQKRLTTRTIDGAALVHNGIFSQYGKKEGNSDTTQFITNILAPLQALKTAAGGSLTDSDLRPTLAGLCGYNSKIAILTAAGSLETYGSGWIEDGGLLFSNGTYKAARYYTSSNSKTTKTSGGRWEWEGGGWEWIDYEPAQFYTKTNNATSKADQKTPNSPNSANQDGSDWLTAAALDALARDCKFATYWELYKDSGASLEDVYEYYCEGLEC
jgi:predicted glutamine amidotransferase